MAHARWSTNEWLDVVRVLYETIPTLVNSKDAREVFAVDLEDAMKKVLPRERWHRHFNMTNNRKSIMFYVRQLNMSAQEAAHIERQKQEEAQARLNQRHAMRADAMSPLIDLIAEKLFLKLSPMLEEYIVLRNEGNTPCEAQQQIINPKVARKRVGVIGPIPIQQSELKNSFPFLEFEFDEGKNISRNSLSGFSRCDVIFGLTTKISHDVENKLKSIPHAWVKYRRVNGGTSSVKRSIEIWLAESKG